MNGSPKPSAELDPTVLAGLHPAASALVALEAPSVATLEQLVGEPVLLEVESQMQTVLPWPDVDLWVAHQYESALLQVVRLRGARSRRVWTNVASVLLTHLVDPEVRSSLESRTQTSEQALAAVYPDAERRRQTLSWWCGPGGDKSQDFGLDAATWLVNRTSRVLVRDRPVLKIEERFPAYDGWPEMASAAGPPAG
jgi:hypothetical protein